MITREEYELLKEYRRLGFKWLARDNNEELYVYETEPMQLTCTWFSFDIGDEIDVICDYDRLLQCVKWEDEEPTRIDDLIRDYESHKIITGGNNVNKSELIKEIEDIFYNIGIHDYRIGERCEITTWGIDSKTIRKILSAIEKHSPDGVKVTCPQFVADWISEVKALERTFKLEILFDTTEMPDEVFDWLDERYGDTDILAKAWLDGFEIEKEKLYTVRLANGNCLYRFLSLGIDWMKGYSDYKNDPSCRLTQSEIESVDPVLMQIAKEVE